MLDEGKEYKLGKKNCDFNFPADTPYTYEYIFKNVENRIFVIDRSKEYSNRGIFFRINPMEEYYVKAGDVITIGQSTFSLLPFNRENFIKEFGYNWTI